MFDESQQRWSSSTESIPNGVKVQLKPFLTKELADQTNKCTIKQMVEVLRQNKEEIVEVLVECYENATENKMNEYVWDFITPTSKFNDQMLKLAESVEKNWSNIVHTKLSAAEEAEKLKTRKRPAKNQAEEEMQREPPPKKSVPRYIPPRSVVNDENYGRIRVAPKSQRSKSSSTAATSPLSASNNSTTSKPSPKSGTKKVLQSTSSNGNSNSAAVKPSLAQELLSLILNHSKKRKSRISIPATKTANQANNKSSPSPRHVVEEEKIVVDDESEIDIHMSRSHNSNTSYSITRQARTLPPTVTSKAPIPTTNNIASLKSLNKNDSKRVSVSTSSNGNLNSAATFSTKKLSPAQLLRKSQKRKTVCFSTPSESASNKNDSNREKINSPPLSQSLTEEVEDDEESEIEEEVYISRPRDSSYYSRFSNTRQTRTSPLSSNSNTRKHDDDIDDSRPNDTVSMDQQEHDNAADSHSNDEKSDESENDDFPSLGPRNLDRYNATVPPSAFQVYDVSSDEDDDILERPRTITFDEAITKQKRSNKSSAHRGNAIAASLQPHDTIDPESKVNMAGSNPGKELIAFPNQIGLSPRPAYCMLESWLPETKYIKNINKSISEFRNFRQNRSAPEHLFIVDAMLSGVPITSTYKKIEKIDCRYPNNPFLITDYLQKEIEEKRNDYIIKNIFICIGLDFIAHDPDVKRAIDNARRFIEAILNRVIKAFDPRKGPKRYKRDGEVIDVLPPKLIFITIPQVKSSSGIYTMKNEIYKMNKCIRKCVEKGRELAEKKRVIMELYDWEKEAAEFDQCNEEHLGRRNDIFMTHLSNEYALLMYRPDEISMGMNCCF